MAALERIEPAIGVLFQELEIGEVVLDTAGVQIAENTDSGLLIHKKKPTEVGIELLNTCANTDEIVVCTEIVQLYFRESFLQP